MLWYRRQNNDLVRSTWLNGGFCDCGTDDRITTWFVLPGLTEVSVLVIGTDDRTMTRFVLPSLTKVSLVVVLTTERRLGSFYLA